MHLPFRSIAVISAVLVFAFALSTVDAAGIRPSCLDGHNSRHDRSNNVFPSLKWLIESAIELVFGKIPGKAKESRPDEALQARYRDDVVIRFNVSTSEEEGALSKAADQMLLDVWAFTPEFVDIRLHKEDVTSLLTLLPASLQPSVLIPDVSAAVMATYPSKAADGNRFDSDTGDSDKMRTLVADGVDNIFFRDYQPLSVITSWMRLIQAMFPSYVQMTSVGQSYEGRDIPALRVGDRSGDHAEDGPRKTILITGGVHGREWISTSTVTYLAWSVITAFGKEQVITKLLQHFDIVFVPVLNPDGYEYTWHSDRLWRKSRQETKMSYCRGLDLDRAFGYEWESARHHSDPCSESYGGDQPFQAVEASELAKWAGNQTLNGVRFVALLDLHSYSQQILFPYSYTCSIDPPNRENLEELAVGLAKAIRISSGEYYSVASACEGAVARDYSTTSDALPRIESGGGSAIDWFYHDLHARYSYQIKLRDTGSYGFLLPSENIIPTGEEMLQALKYFVDYLLGNNGIEKSPVQKSLYDGEEWKDLRKRRR
ncbi:hypothetical protein QBC46DRAFT_278284 [Diplogelasinospora grovesii]|uniref:Inactive metallocarboxypeptidase ECM14 n=1 Tax=Diplogelasinospora grovesii TaxID=303347 RepID=A0AAN6NHS4_9PEZI|nr:hypothetical protein QBC46DRAFT_278284 [Diplogelasinospora grovesii]